jgi:hypothetical protein
MSGILTLSHSPSIAVAYDFGKFEKIVELGVFQSLSSLGTLGA